MSFLSNETFLGQQREAVFSDNPAIAVTAGAGSGKTRSLVGRALRLLERGYPLRSILAITFTEKAAREMRGRIRKALSRTQNSEFKIQNSELDFARIGTIHSLCAEILRQYPAEAGLDPAFAVLEEGLAAALKAEAVDSTLAWAAEDPEAVTLFDALKESELRQALGFLLEWRLDVIFWHTDFELSLQAYLSRHLDSPAWLDPLADVSAYAATNPDDKLELARREVLARWDEAQTARAAKNWDVLLAKLAELRKATSTQGQKANWNPASLDAAREAMAEIRQFYDENLKFLAEKARFALDEQVAEHLPKLLRLLEQVLAEYQRRKDERQALDFDDLEGRAARLLTEFPAVRAELRSSLRAVLVDEFQDTNERQRQIVYALTGFTSDLRGENRESKIENSKPVDLFIVGDSKQSIYKFRGADVSVFRQVQRDIETSGGQRLDLDLTFRAHKGLLQTLNQLLAPILGETDDPARPHLVPFAPLRPHHEQPARPEIQPPYVEFHLGLGEDAEEGRQIAAESLAIRLRELHETEKFAWGEVALLFRASSAFPAYETALEAAGIPFVTVAGRGFYDRPEIRDILNILAAIADPADDLALVGLLRSPAFAIPDAEIYKLRFPDSVDQPASLSAALLDPSIHPSSFIFHPSKVLTELRALAGRAPAAAVLKRLLDLTGYRAILSTAPNGARMLRNVEKLLADAHRSRLTSLPAFLAYVCTLRDVGLREGEAPADGLSGAVQLMTVHKAKGLEFPLTVIADASYEPRPRSAKIQLASGQLLLDRNDNEDRHPTAWQIAGQHAKEVDAAEDCRLLYVAATRAKEKLLISGHVKAKKDGSLAIPGWLGKLRLEQIKISGDMSTPRQYPVTEPGLTVTLYPVKPAQADSPPPVSATQTITSRKPDLLEPLPAALPITDEKARARESDPPQRVWRIVPDTQRPHAPAWVVGKLVHESLRRWKFPDSSFEAFIQPFALESGLADPGETQAAIHETRRLLERLRAHPLYTELDQAERHHEIPYETPAGRGIIDLLYRAGNGWVLLDFKTDDLRSEEQARAAIREKGYDRQLARYAQAIQEQLGVQPHIRLVFINLHSQLAIFNL